MNQPTESESEFESDAKSRQTRESREAQEAREAREALGARLMRIKRVAQALDGQFHIPLTSIRIGFDSLLGFIPGIGDFVGGALSLWIIYEAHRAGASGRALIQMLANTVLDVFGGSVPIVGDVFDIYWKSNIKNVQLLEDDLKRTSKR